MDATNDLGVGAGHACRDAALKGLEAREYGVLFLKGYIKYRCLIIIAR